VWCSVLSPDVRNSRVCFFIQKRIVVSDFFDCGDDEKSFEIVSVHFTLPAAVTSAIRMLKLVEAITVINSCLQCNGGKAFVILHWCDKCKMTPVHTETRYCSLVYTFIVHLIVEVIPVRLLYGRKTE
jgi:hypothetical protein